MVNFEISLEQNSTLDHLDIWSYVAVHSCCILASSD